MRAHISHEVMYLDLDHSEMMVRWGEGPRRKRVKPRSLTVSYSKDGGEDWALTCVYMGADRVHKSSTFGLGVYFYDFGKLKYPMPDWMDDLVDAARPA